MPKSNTRSTMSYDIEGVSIVLLLRLGDELWRARVRIAGDSGRCPASLFSILQKTILCRWRFARILERIFLYTSIVLMPCELT